MGGGGEGTGGGGEGCGWGEEVRVRGGEGERRGKGWSGGRRAAPRIKIIKIIKITVF